MADHREFNHIYDKALNVFSNGFNSLVSNGITIGTALWAGRIKPVTVEIKPPTESENNSVSVPIPFARGERAGEELAIARGLLDQGIPADDVRHRIEQMDMAQRSQDPSQVASLVVGKIQGEKALEALGDAAKEQMEVKKAPKLVK
jgi:hypothetical protein